MLDAHRKIDCAVPNQDPDKVIHLAHFGSLGTPRFPNISDEITERKNKQQDLKTKYRELRGYQKVRLRHKCTAYTGSRKIGFNG